MSQDFKVHQFHYSASLGDAVTNHMLLIQRALKLIGIEGSVFTVERKHIDTTQVLPFKREKIWDCDLLLLHHSHGNPILGEVLDLEIPKALVYHNVTPAHFYPHDTLIQRLCALGRLQLKQIKGCVFMAFADSKYNAAELLDLGYSNVEPLPLLDLSGMEIENSEREKTDPAAPKNLLFVGRLSLHKNQSLLIETFFYLKQKLPRHSRLTLVGGGDPVYTRYLKLLAKQLGISHSILFAGKVTDKELSHFYESAEAFLCTSLHEGFCIPLVEAMRAKLPVFYLPEGAIPETMGSAGLRLETRSPIAIAEVLGHALFDEETLSAIHRSQEQRLGELKKEQTLNRIQERLTALLPTIETRHFDEPRPMEQHDV